MPKAALELSHLVTGLSLVPLPLNQTAFGLHAVLNHVQLAALTSTFCKVSATQLIHNFNPPFTNTISQTSKPPLGLHHIFPCTSTAGLLQIREPTGMLVAPAQANYFPSFPAPLKESGRKVPQERKPSFRAAEAAKRKTQGTEKALGIVAAASHWDLNPYYSFLQPSNSTRQFGLMLGDAGKDALCALAENGRNVPRILQLWNCKGSEFRIEAGHAPWTSIPRIPQPAKSHLRSTAIMCRVAAFVEVHGVLKVAEVSHSCFMGMPDTKRFFVLENNRGWQVIQLSFVLEPINKGEWERHHDGSCIVSSLRYTSEVSFPLFLLEAAKPSTKGSCRTCKAKAGHDKLTSWSCTCKTVSEQAKEEERNGRKKKQPPKSIEEPGKDLNSLCGKSSSPTPCLGRKPYTTSDKWMSNIFLKTSRDGAFTTSGGNMPCGLQLPEFTSQRMGNPEVDNSSSSSSSLLNPRMKRQGANRASVYHTASRCKSRDRGECCNGHKSETQPDEVDAECGFLVTLPRIAIWGEGAEWEFPHDVAGALRWRCGEGAFMHRVGSVIGRMQGRGLRLEGWGYARKGAGRQTLPALNLDWNSSRYRRMGCALKQGPVDSFVRGSKGGIQERLTKQQIQNTSARSKGEQEAIRESKERGSNRIKGKALIPRRITRGVMGTRFARDCDSELSSGTGTGLWPVGNRAVQAVVELAKLYLACGGSRLRMKPFPFPEVQRLGTAELVHFTLELEASLTVSKPVRQLCWLFLSSSIPQAQVDRLPIYHHIGGVVRRIAVHLKLLTAGRRISSTELRKTPTSTRRFRRMESERMEFKQGLMNWFTSRGSERREETMEREILVLFSSTNPTEPRPKVLKRGNEKFQVKHNWAFNARLLSGCAAQVEQVQGGEGNSHKNKRISYLLSLLAFSPMSQLCTRIQDENRTQTGKMQEYRILTCLILQRSLESPTWGEKNRLTLEFPQPYLSIYFPWARNRIAPLSENKQPRTEEVSAVEGPGDKHKGVIKAAPCTYGSNCRVKLILTLPSSLPKTWHCELGWPASPHRPHPAKKRKGKEKRKEMKGRGREGKGRRDEGKGKERKEEMKGRGRKGKERKKERKGRGREGKGRRDEGKWKERKGKERKEKRKGKEKRKEIKGRGRERKKR
ncbi:hypothetical protein L345_16022, partial [Ophiophagus hannah]